MMLAGLCLGGCGGETSGPSQSSTGILCANETRADTFRVGLEKSASAFTVRLQDSTVEGFFGPPDRGFNTWAVEIVDASGAPMSPEEVKLKPWMPDHGHGTTPLLHYGVQEGGQYTLGPFDIHMGGYWEFTVTVTTGGAEEQVKFGFCVEG